MEKFQRVLSRDSMGEVKEIVDSSKEIKSGKGYCDYLFVPKKKEKPAIILELKVDDSAESAVRQIKEKGYMQRVEHCNTVLFVGINYDKKDKIHQCLIEKHEF